MWRLQINQKVIKKTWGNRYICQNYFPNCTCLSHWLQHSFFRQIKIVDIAYTWLMNKELLLKTIYELANQMHRALETKKWISITT